MGKSVRLEQVQHTLMAMVAIEHITERKGLVHGRFKLLHLLKGCIYMC